jgi:predicted dehydrogenase
VIPDMADVELVGYVDPDASALDALHQEAGVPSDRCFNRLDEAIIAMRPQALLNTTHPAAHVSVTKAALDAGLHVLVEKPFALTMGDARELVDLALLKGLTLMVSQNMRFYPGPQAIASLIREATFGHLHAISIDFRRDLLAGPNPLPRRHVEERQLLADMSVHHFDLLRMVLDREPTRIECEAWHPPWSAFGGPAVAAATIVFGRDLVASYRGSLISAGPPTPWSGEWRLEFEEGELLWTGHPEDPGHDVVSIRPRTGNARFVQMPSLMRTGLSASLAEFAQAVETGREPQASGRDNLGTLALTLAAIESATQGGAVTRVALGDRHAPVSEGSRGLFGELRHSTDDTSNNR